MADKELTEDDLRIFLDEEEKSALGYSWGTLTKERAAAQDYYFARPYGNELEGRSDIVSTQVFDTIEWALPELIRVFAATDKAVEFEPQGPEDEESAAQATDVCNYVFWRQNPGFLILYSWFKDALLQKNGVIKWWWQTSTQKIRRKFSGLTVEMVTMLTNREDVTIVSKDEYPDPLISRMLQQRIAQAQQMGQPLPPQLPQVPNVYDVTLEYVQESGKICIEPVPPEEFVVSRRHNSMLLNETPYCAHVREVTISELRSMGYEVDEDDAELTSDGAQWESWSAEKIARSAKNEDGMLGEMESIAIDPSQRRVWMREIYCKFDFDNDGNAEQRRIVRAGNKIMSNEICEHVQMAAITPIIIAHRFFGMSWAEMVMDLQFLCSTLWRQMLDNLFHANNQGHIVLSSADGRVQANIDSLLDSRPGRIIQEYAPNAVRPEVVPWVGHQAFPMLEYIDQQRMNRSGLNYLSSGLDANSINKTARGAVLAENKMQQKMELVARIFAEGFKEVFKGMQYMLAKYQTKPMTFRLRNKFVSYDPSDWKTQYDMTINVGLGTGNKDQQAQHLAIILQDQMALLQTPLGPQMVTPKNLYNVRAKMVENAGFRNVTEFYTEPKQGQIPPPQPAPPDPLAVADLQLKKTEVEVKKFDAETKRMEAQAKAQLEGAKVMQTGQQNEHTRGMDQANLIAAQRPGDEANLQRQASDQSLAAIVQAMGALTQFVAQADERSAQRDQIFLQALSQIAAPKSRVIVRDPKTQLAIRADEVPIQH